MSDESKASVIRRYLETTDYSSREIARRTGYESAYVRVVMQRLAGGGTAPADKKYYAANREMIIKKAGVRVKKSRARRKQQATHASG